MQYVLLHNHNCRVSLGLALLYVVMVIFIYYFIYSRVAVKTVEAIIF